MSTLLSKSLLGAFIILGLLGISLLAFGGNSGLKTELSYDNRVPTFESVADLKSITISRVNVTQEASKTLAEQIIAKNSEGPATGKTGPEISVEDISKSAQDLLTQSIENFNPEELKPSILLGDLKITKSAESAPAENYFNSLSAINTKYFAQLEINSENPGSEDLSALMYAYGSAAADALTLSVPQPLASLHQRYLVLMLAHKNAFSLMKNFEQDALKALLASQARSVFSLELEQVFDEMDNYIVRRQLTLK